MQRTPVTLIERLAVLLVLMAVVALGGMASYGPDGSAAWTCPAAGGRQGAHRPPHHGRGVGLTGSGGRRRRSTGTPNRANTVSAAARCAPAVSSSPSAPAAVAMPARAYASSVRKLTEVAAR